MQLIAQYLPPPQQRKYWLFATDVTYQPRQFASTLADRTYVYRPNPVAGNKPVTIGHDYSISSFLPEKPNRLRMGCRHRRFAPPWVAPLIVRWVKSTEKASQVGTEQISAITSDETLPFHDELCVLTEDASYSGRAHLAAVASIPNLVSIVRLPRNRVVYRRFTPPDEDERPPGHPKWYGDRFDLKDPDTWPEPDDTAEGAVETKQGERHTAYVEGWHDMVRTGTREIPMHKYPFTLVRIRVVDADGEPVYKQPTWLVVLGERREELSLADIWQAYDQRSDGEHFHRFGKQNLLMADYQTPEVDHEENWWQIVQLAYISLWLARSLAEVHRRPWERYLPQPEPGCPSPSLVQRDLERIILKLGTPARPPEPRGYSPGRAKGSKPPPRERQPVIRKG
ncbi:MAG: transposase [Chloroflexota bacterium]|nr:transposase [Chloroflexota bacterium]